MKIQLILFFVICLNLTSCFDNTQPYEVVYGAANPIEDKVWVCISKSAKKYHKRKCYGFDRCTHRTEHITISDAKDKGYTECRICYRY